MNITLRKFIDFVYDNQYHIEYKDDHILIYYTEYIDKVSFETLYYFMSCVPEFKVMDRKEKLKRI